MEGAEDLAAAPPAVYRRSLAAALASSRLVVYTQPVRAASFEEGDGLTPRQSTGMRRCDDRRWGQGATRCPPICQRWLIQCSPGPGITSPASLPATVVAPMTSGTKP